MTAGSVRMSRPVQATTYGTPDDFLEAVRKRFGSIHFDLAAEDGHEIVPGHFSPQQNALVQDWTLVGGRLWLNPPFSAIAPWAKKCADTVSATREANILFLTPASVGSRWFVDHVWPNADVYALVGRLTFKGETQPFPKDCVLSHFHKDGGRRFAPWDWRQ